MYLVAVNVFFNVQQDTDSGLRTLATRDWSDRQSNDVYYSYNNFIIGTKLPAQYSFQVGGGVGVSCLARVNSINSSELD